MGASLVAERLAELGEHVQGLVAHGRQTLDENDADQWKMLALARFEMLQALDRFITFKEDRILVPIMCRAEGAAAETAKALKAKNHDLQNEYDAFILRWGLTSPLSPAEAYKVEARTMGARIEHQVAADIRVITALLAGVAGIQS